MDATFSLDRLQVSLDSARGSVVQANRTARRAPCARHALARREHALVTPRGGDFAALRPARARAPRRPARRAPRAAERPRRPHLRAVLQRAQSDLAAAHDRARRGLVRSRGRLAARRARLLGPATSSRSAAGPPSSRSSHHHHDYPAADIAAPAGLAALRARGRHRRATRGRTPDGRCGIGFTIAHRGRPELDVLPPLLPGSGRRRRHRARRGHAGRPRRLDRPRDRAAPPPPARPGDLVPAGRSRGSRRFAGTAFRWQDADPTDSVGRPGAARPSSPSSPSARRTRVAGHHASPGRGMTSRLPTLPKAMSMAFRLSYALAPRGRCGPDRRAARDRDVHVRRGRDDRRALARREAADPGAADRARRPGRPRPGLRLRQGHPRGRAASPGTSPARCAATPRTASSGRTRPPARTSIDTGAPTIVLRLANGAYGERGAAARTLSYAGTTIRLANLAAATAPADSRDQAGAPSPPRSRSRSPRPSPSRSRSPRRQADAKRARPRSPSPARRTSRSTRSRSPPGRSASRPGSRTRKKTREQRPALALPARVDRHRRAVRLVARRRGAADPDPRRRARPAPVGHRRRSEAVARAALARVRRQSR